MNTSELIETMMMWAIPGLILITLMIGLVVGLNSALMGSNDKSLHRARIYIYTYRAIKCINGDKNNPLIVDLTKNEEDIKKCFNDDRNTVVITYYINDKEVKKIGKYSYPVERVIKIPVVIVNNTQIYNGEIKIGVGVK